MLLEQFFKVIYVKVYFHTQFLDVQIHCCYFHFSQSVYRRLASLKLASEYANVLKVNIHCKMLVSLSFLPLSKVVEGFRAVCRSIEEANLSVQLKDFLEYFARAYVGVTTLGGVEK